MDSDERRKIDGVEPCQTTLAISPRVFKGERAWSSSFDAQRSAQPAPAGALRFFFQRGSAKVVTKATDIDPKLWRATFGSSHKNFEYYRLIEETVQTGFTYRYLVLVDLEERPIALQPLMIVDQDLAMAIDGRIGRAIKSIRRRLPRFLHSRILMAGCLAGDGKLGILPEVNPSFVSELLAEALQQFARSQAISLIAIKDFSPSLRSHLRPLIRGGYTRLDGFPSLHLDLTFSSVEDYMRQRLSRVTRKSLKRKLKKTAGVIPKIELEVRNDCSEMIDELYPLYLNVSQRGNVVFEVFTKEFFLEMSRRMPECVRYFIWRQNGKPVAFSFCTIWGDTIYDNDIGLDYAVAYKLNLYHLTFHDILDWALKNHMRFYETGAFNYDVKLHLGLCPDRLDIYVRHRSLIINLLLKFVAPVFAPAKSDPALRKYFRVHNGA